MTARSIPCPLQRPDHGHAEVFPCPVCLSAGGTHTGVSVERLLKAFRFLALVESMANA